MPDLQIGRNEISLNFVNLYKKEGCGLHSFTDSEDGEQYLYSQFESDYCRWVFPCFDQPDIKAKWSLTCVVDKYWTVISNEPEIMHADCGAIEEVKGLSNKFSVQIREQDLKCIKFKESFKISTYLYAICAGPY